MLKIIFSLIAVFMIYMLSSKNNTLKGGADGDDDDTAPVAGATDVFVDDVDDEPTSLPNPPIPSEPVATTDNSAMETPPQVEPAVLSDPAETQEQIDTRLRLKEVELRKEEERLRMEDERLFQKEELLSQTEARLNEEANMAPVTMAPDTMPPVTMDPDTMPPVTMAPDTMGPDTMPPVTMAPDTMPSQEIAEEIDIIMKIQGNSVNYSCTLNDANLVSPEPPVAQPPIPEPPVAQPPVPEPPVAQPLVPEPPVAQPPVPEPPLDPATTDLANPVKDRTRTEGGNKEIIGEFPLSNLNEENENEDIIMNMQR
tara:strand:- start:689 stop:1624 length:936 start_codon:yes stop_codon:yes gene_type:complete